MAAMVVPAGYETRDNKRKPLSEREKVDRARQVENALVRHPEIHTLMKDIFSRVRYFQANRDHTGGFTALRAADKLGLVKGKRNMVVINVDSHSDLYHYHTSQYNPASLKKDLNIANWVNFTLQRYPQAKEFIWVLPPEIKRAKYAFNCNAHAFIPVRGPTKLYLSKDPTDLRTYYNRKPRDYDPKRYNCISVRCLTADKLPDLKGRPVYLSIDMDYFHNSGYDTIGSTEVPWSPRRVLQLFKHLKRAHVRPFAVNTALSPDYSLGWYYNNLRFISVPFARIINPIRHAIARVCRERLGEPASRLPRQPAHP